MNELIALDRNWFIELNGLHAPWLDPIMYWISQTEIWIPLYAFWLIVIIKRYKKQSWLPILGIILTIALCDQLTSSLMKPYFSRLRPTHDPELSSLVHIVNHYKGGLYGFASSHAANTLGLATFLCLLFRKKTKLVWLMLPWAVVVSYSRIYLGVHFPFDVIVGGALGVLIAYGFYLICTAAIAKLDNRNQLSL